MNDRMCTKCELHQYDEGNLLGELGTLQRVKDLLRSTEVPEYVHLIITEQIRDIELILSRGQDPRLEG